MVTFVVRSWEFSAQPIKVAGEPGTSSGSISLVAENCQPGVAVIPIALLYADPLLNEEEFTPERKGRSGLTDPLQRPVHMGEKLKRPSPSSAYRIARWRCHVFLGCAGI